MATKLGRGLRHNKEFTLIKTHDLSISWSYEVT